MKTLSNIRSAVRLFSERKGVGGEEVLLAIYTLFNVEGSDASSARSIAEAIIGQPLVDYKATLEYIHSLGMITAQRYNWRTNSYDYKIADECLIPAMIYFYEENPDLTIKVLEQARDLTPSHVQKMLWQFISSKYSSIRIEEVSDYNISQSLQAFVPAVCDARFAPLISIFNATNFHDLMTKVFDEAFKNESIIDSDYLRTVMGKYKFRNMDYDEAIQQLLCLCDLYDYLSKGKMPMMLLSSYAEHHVIAAISEAYHNRLHQSMEHFKKAIAIGNKSNGFYTTTKNYLPYAVENFFYTVVSNKLGNDEGRKRMLAVARAPESDITQVGKMLYAVFGNSITEKQLRDRLNLLYEKGGMDRTLATIVCRYIGKEFTNNAVPQWDVMKHELSPFEKNGTQLTSLFGGEPILHSIYHKKAWESVLEDLSGLDSIDRKEGPKKQLRIGYFMRNTSSDVASVRQQATLKNGAWGAGKQVNAQMFFGCETEGMTEADRRIVETEISQNEPHHRSIYVKLKNVLPEMTKESRLYVGDYAPFTLVEVTEEMPYITLHHDRDGFLITSNVDAEEVESDVIITHRGVASINFIRLTNAQRPYYRRLLSIERFPNEAEPQLRKFLNSIGGKIEVNSDLIEGGSTLPITDGNPRLVMQMRPNSGGRGSDPTYKVSFFVRPLDGGRIRQIPGEGNDIIVDSGIQHDEEGNEKYVRTRVKRNREKERKNINALVDALYEEVPEMLQILTEETVTIPSFNLLPMLEYAQANPESIACEWPEGAQLRIKHRSTTASWNGTIVKNDNGWFEIEGSVELDQGKVVSMAQLLELASQSKGRFITLGGGDFLALSNKLRKQLDQLGSLASQQHGKLQMSPFSAALLGPDILEGELFLTMDDELKAIRQRIKESSTYSPPVPENLNATLRKYQMEGFQWMSRLNRWGAGALLADDMGLGKTIQTITFLLSKAEEGPALVVAPASVAPNWKVEFEKFAPSLNITMLNFEQDRNAAIRNAEAGDVIVCTYMLLLSVKDEITRKKWNTICLDEAHIIKNRGAKTSAVAMKLKSDNRIMLTGTPVQNHLGELWNLFQFVNPGLLGSFESFNRRFIVPIEQNKDKAAQHRLDRLVKPFMLRRTKDKVAKELPEKEEIYQHVEMNEEEQLTYEALRQHAEMMLLAENSDTVSMNTLAEITRLRLAACCGSKVTALLELLMTIIEGLDGETADGTPETTLGEGKDNGGGVLVFSQFTTYLATIREALDKAKIPYLYIDGTVNIKERQHLVEKFQNGKCPVFLISLKAGGLGLNLTHANYVVHMDPWWNPAIEAQATDRAHRIGQKRSVTVYHLISEGTIEEKIQRLHEKKQNLVENILEATDMSYKLTGEELLKMLKK